VERVLVALEKALGVHLRGVKAGQPLEAKKPKGKSKEEEKKAEPEHPAKPQLQQLI
jgi:hypothetical protein